MIYLAPGKLHRNAPWLRQAPATAHWPCPLLCLDREQLNIWRSHLAPRAEWAWKVGFHIPLFTVSQPEAQHPARWGHPQHPGMPREWCHKYRRSQDQPQKARRPMAFMTWCHLEMVSDEAGLLLPTPDWKILTGSWDGCLVLFVPLVHD